MPATAVPQEVLDRVVELRSQIAHHNELYYRNANPEISDQEYDKLIHELDQLEEKHPEIRDELSPTQYVGNDLTGGFPEVEHKVGMLSIGNVFDEDELEKFLKRVSNAIHGTPNSPVEYTVEPKVDGAAVTLFYEGGILRYAATRGNGKKGEVITENMLTSPDVPRTIPFKGTLELRGEAFIARKDFEAINAEREQAGLELFKNPRNACAGALKQKDPREAAKRRLRFVCHGHGLIDILEDTWSEMVLKLREATGGNIAFNPVFTAKSGKQGLLELIETIDQARLEYDFEIDGAVIKVNSIDQREQVGLGNKAPKWAAAFKYATEQVWAKVVDIQWQVGRTGAVTPVCIIEPTELCGTTVQRATLHNAEWFQKFNIHHGDSVLVQKAGEIIPQVLECKHTGGMVKYQIPTVCPSCGGPLKFEQDGKGPGLLCMNPDCPDQLVGRIQHYCSRDRMDIEGFGEKICQQLVESGLVKRLPDLYRLSVDDLASLPRMAQKSAQKLWNRLNEKLTPDLALFVSALGIPEVGRTVSREFAIHFETLEKIRTATREDMEKIDGIGPSISGAAHTFFHSQKGAALVDDLLAAGVTPMETTIDTSGHDERFAGKKFVITGTLHIGRKEAQAFIESRGGKCAGSVSKKTDVVIVGAEAGSKADKALALGIEIWDAEHFASIQGG